MQKISVLGYGYYGKVFDFTTVPTTSRRRHSEKLTLFYGPLKRLFNNNIFFFKRNKLVIVDINAIIKHDFWFGFMK